MQYLDFFVSYNTKDKMLAGEIGKLVDKAGHKPFLAHDDIKPTEDWENEILHHLDTCNALIAVITPSFADSVYANQEVGIIMGKGKLVIPLRLNESQLPGFVKSSQAIPASESRLSDAVERAVRTAEDKAKTAFVRPPKITSATELIDTRLEQRNEPYWRVSVKLQGGHSMIPKTTQADRWLSNAQNLPQIMTYMSVKTTANGWTFTASGPRFAELTSDGEFCYGAAIRSNEEVIMQKGIRLLSEMTNFEARIIKQFDIRAPFPTYIYPALKLGRAHGLSLSTAITYDPSEERHTTEDQEVVVQQSPLLDDWNKNPRPILEQMVSQFCRSFGISLDENYASILIASALNNM